MTSSNKITVIRGDTHTLHLTFRANDELLDLTGAIVFLTVKQDLNDPDTLAQISKSIGNIPNPTLGVVDIELTEDDTSVAGEYWYDIQLKQASSSVQSSLKGKFIIEQDVTLRVS
ncbi:MAG: BppU family phage baseplate upper protein [Agathobacter rectalis]